MEGMVDKQQRAALESQINEFGQCPRSAWGKLGRIGCTSVVGWGGVGLGGLSSALAVVVLATMVLSPHLPILQQHLA